MCERKTNCVNFTIKSISKNYNKKAKNGLIFKIQVPICNKIKFGNFKNLVKVKIKLEWLRKLAVEMI